MQVSIRLFALARERAGQPTISVELPEPARVRDLRRALAETCPALAPLIPNLMIAVDSDYADDDREIRPGSELAAIPPVSGG